MKKHVNVMVLLAIMCTNLISCNSSSSKDPKAFDLAHAKKVNISMEELNPKFELPNYFDGTDNSYHNGLRTFEKNGLYGYVDQNSLVVISPQFKYAQEFYNEKRAIVSSDGNKYGVIDRRGTYIIMPQFDDIISLTTNYDLYRVGKNGEVGIIDSTGSIVVNYGEYDDVGYSGYYGYVKVRKDDKWGFIDIKGMEIVNPQYDEIELPLDPEGFAAVRKNNKWGLIDLNGNVIIPIEHKQAGCSAKEYPAQIFPFEGKYDREILYFEIYKNGTVIAKTY